MSDRCHLFGLWKYWKAGTDSRQHRPTLFVEAIAGDFDHEPPEQDLLEAMVLCEPRFTASNETVELIRYVVVADDEWRKTLSEPGWRGDRVRLHSPGQDDSVVTKMLAFYGVPVSSLSDPESQLLAPYVNYGPDIDLLIEQFERHDAADQQKRREVAASRRRRGSGGMSV